MRSTTEVAAALKKLFSFQTEQAPPLPDPELPFDNRWKTAQALSVNQQAEFVRREFVKACIDLQLLHTDAYTYTVGKDIDIPTFTASSLPSSIRDSLIPSLTRKPHGDLPQILKLWIRQDSMPHYYSARLLLGVMDQDTITPRPWLSNGIEVVAFIHRNRERRGSIKGNVHGYTPGLAQYVREVGQFSVARDLVRFASDVSPLR